MRRLLTAAIAHALVALPIFATTYQVGPTRPYANRNFVFPVTLPPRSEQAYFFRLQSNTDLLVPAQIWSPEAFQAHERKDYIIQNGIAASRLIAKGYGETRLLDDCTQYPECPSDNSSDCACHQNNRRTEFKVVGQLDADLIYEDKRFGDEVTEDDAEKKKGKEK